MNRCYRISNFISGLIFFILFNLISELNSIYFEIIIIFMQMIIFNIEMVKL
jgi:hypothetical protein